MNKERGLAGLAAVRKRCLPSARSVLAKVLYAAGAIVVGGLLAGLAMIPRHHGASAEGAMGPKLSLPRVDLVTLADSRPSNNSGDHFFIFIVLDPLRRPYRVSSRALEERLRQRLNRSGFPNIGMSVSRDGAVYLAGTLRSESEKRVVEQIVRDTRGVTVVHFRDLAIRELYGPGYLGVETVAMPSGEVLVTKVWDGSPAQMAGIRIGDVLVRFGSQRITDPQSFRYMVMARVSGQRVPVTIERGIERRTVMVRIGGVSAVALK